MSNLSDTKLVSGRTPVIGYSTRKTNASDNLSEVLPPDAYEGSFIYANGQMNFSNGTEWTTTEPPPINTPTPRTPTTSFEQRQLRLTNFRTSKDYNDITQTGVIFQVSLTNDMLNPITLPVNSTTSSSYNLAIDQMVGTTRLLPGTKFYWRGQYTGTGGQESAFSRTQEQTFPEYIDPPIAKTLADTTQNVIEISTYVSAFNLPGEIDSVNYTTQWRAYNNSSDTEDSPTVFFEEDSDHDSKFDTLNYTASGQVYYWQARQVSFSGATTYRSPWSTIQKQRQISDIGVPTPVSAIGVPLVQLEITPFVSNTQPKATLGTAIWEVYNNQEAGNRLENVTVTFNPQATTDSVTEKKSLSAMAKFQTEDFVNLDTEVPYYWRARYETTLGSSSEWSTLVPLRFIRPAYIDTPISTVASGVELTRFKISDFSSYYPTVSYISTIWEIFDSTVVLEGTTPLATFTVININTRSISPYIIAQANLQPGEIYYWRAKYTASYNQKTITSNATALNAYIQPYSIQKPEVTRINTTVRGPQFSFTTTKPFQKIPDIDYIENHVSSDWELLRVKSNGTSEPYDSVTNSVVYKTTWTSQKVDENSTFKVRVRYNGIGSSSEWSDYVQFNTLEVYNDVITPLFTPTSIPPKLALGDFYAGGYNAGKMWQQIAQTDTRIDTTITFVGSEVSYPEKVEVNSYQTSYSINSNNNNREVVKTNSAYWYTFNLTDEYNNAYSQQTQGPLFYIGQIVRLRSKWNKYTSLEGYVVKAFGTKLIVGVYKITLGYPRQYVADFTRTDSNAIIGAGWWIQTRYYIIVPDNRQYNAGYSREYLYKYNSDRRDQKIPYQWLSLTNGYESTRALVAENNSILSEADKYNLLDRMKDDIADGWYIPSRDELLLAFNTFSDKFTSTPTIFNNLGKHGDRDSDNFYQELISADFNDDVYYSPGGGMGPFDQYLITPDHTDEPPIIQYNTKSTQPQKLRTSLFSRVVKYLCSTFVFSSGNSYNIKLIYDDAKKLSTFEYFNTHITAPRFYVSSNNISGQGIRFNDTTTTVPGYIYVSSAIHIEYSSNPYVIPTAVKLFKRVPV